MISVISCDDICEIQNITISGSNGFDVIESTQLNQSIISDTLRSSPKYVRVELITDAVNDDDCERSLSNAIIADQITVTFNKDFLINFNTLIPAYTNLYETSLSFTGFEPIYSSDYSVLWIPLNQAYVEAAFFQEESIGISYSIQTSDLLVISDSTTVVLDY